MVIKMRGAGVCGLGRGVRHNNTINTIQGMMVMKMRAHLWAGACGLGHGVQAVGRVGWHMAHKHG